MQTSLYVAFCCVIALSTASSISLPDPSRTDANSSTTRVLSRMTYDEELACQKYSSRTFVPPAEQKHPTLLWTFPGSGSGWVRLLIEHATGEISQVMQTSDT